jgi:putative ABC transport system substrate-binding protein
VAARSSGLDVTLHPVTSVEQLNGAVERAAGGGAGALIVIHDTLTVNYRARIARLALENRLPTICASSPFVEAGGLMTYGPDLAGLFKRAALPVHRILQDAKPTDIPIEQPTRFELRVNLKTAKALGSDDTAIPPAQGRSGDRIDHRRAASRRLQAPWCRRAPTRRWGQRTRDGRG